MELGCQDALPRFSQKNVMRMLQNGREGISLQRLKESSCASTHGFYNMQRNHGSYQGTASAVPSDFK
jgi:hypothetical protein